jgi:hypothetical protein
VVYSYILGVVVFSDAVTWTGVGGSALIAAGILLVNAKSGGPRSQPASRGSGGSKPEGADAAAAEAAGAPEAPGWGGEVGEEKSSAAARDAAGAGVGSKIELRLFVGPAVEADAVAAMDQGPARAAAGQRWAVVKGGGGGGGAGRSSRGDVPELQAARPPYACLQQRQQQQQQQQQELEEDEEEGGQLLLVPDAQRHLGPGDHRAPRDQGL